MANKRTFLQEDHWNLRKQETSERVTSNLSAAFQRAKDKKNPLVRSLFDINKGFLVKIIFVKFLGMFFALLFWTFLYSLSNYTGPFLINHIITYLNDPDRTMQTGIWIVIGIIFARVASTILASRVRILFVKILLKIFPLTIFRLCWG